MNVTNECIIEPEIEEQLQRRRVVKIPKATIDGASITTLINLSKGDPDEHEILALNEVSHPNIIEITDAFRIGTRTVTDEEHFDAVSLEELVQMSGPLI